MQIIAMKYFVLSYDQIVHVIDFMSKLKFMPR